MQIITEGFAVGFTPDRATAGAAVRGGDVCLHRVAADLL